MIENLTWAMIGFAAAGAPFILFYDWSLRTVTAKWIAVTAQNRKIYQDSVNLAYEQGYAAALRLNGLKTTPANEPTGRSEGVRATPIAQT